ncbi:MAG: substrate-binding domain-containing protein [Sphaerochaetaceae bacterium]|jgi:ribose transport system substrate-binding protein|nr:substrate-binding domain-containing protein [Sphaerochaetaceae bacterium]
MKKLTVMLLVALCSISMAFAGGTKEETKSDSSKLIGLSISTLNNPFFVTVVDGAKADAESEGYDLTVVDAGDDVVKQINDIDDLVSKGAKVIIINPVDSDAVAPAVKSAKAAGVKIISVDRAVNGESVSCSIASDNVMGAKLAADYMVSMIGEGAEVAELQGVLGASATIDRGEGFHQVADTKLNIVASQTANFNRAEGLSVMENIYQAHPGIKGVFAHNDEMALGAVQALAGVADDVVIIGFDATDDARDAVANGKLAATVAQQPQLMGERAVQTAVKLLNGETVPQSLPVDVTLVTE